jgi:signal transduction histidine kinase
MHFLGDPAVGDLPDDLRGLLFQAGRELLLNVVKHADADHVTLTTRAAGDEIELAVNDDGRGLAEDAPSSRQGGGGFGLFSLRERLSVIGGQLILRSRPGQGTRVVLRVPRQAPPPQGKVA